MSDLDIKTENSGDKMMEVKNQSKEFGSLALAKKILLLKDSTPIEHAEKAMQARFGVSLAQFDMIADRIIDFVMPMKTPQSGDGYVQSLGKMSPDRSQWTAFMVKEFKEKWKSAK